MHFIIASSEGSITLCGISRSREPWENVAEELHRCLMPMIRYYSFNVEVRRLMRHSKMKVLRTVIADDHAMLRESIMALLSPLPCVTFVGEAKNGEEAIERIHELDPDLLLLDIKMPKHDGLQVLHDLQERQVRTKVIVFSAYVKSLYDSVEESHNVIAYINKIDPQDLVSTITKLAEDMDVASN